MREVVEKKVLSENDRLAAELREALPRREYSLRESSSVLRGPERPRFWKKLWLRSAGTPLWRC